jgi:hypothetical protein
MDPLLYFAFGALFIAAAALIMVLLFGLRVSPSRRLALKNVINILRAIWAFCAISFGTVVGAAYGWDTHGWVGAIAVGFIGFFVGAAAAASPAIILQILR